MKKLIPICAVALFTASSANAMFTLYPDDRPGWESAVGVYEEEFFTDATLNPGVSVVTDVGYVKTATGVWWDKLIRPGYTYQGIPGPTTTTWQFATPLYGFGGNWDPGVPTGPGTNIAVYVGGTLVGEIPRTYNGEFWGFASTDPFASVFLKHGSYLGAWCETYELDNMVYSYIPAPGAMLLGSIGVGLVGWLRRRRTL